ncbi:MAG: phenylalanine--tRNA ligase subunit beta [Bacteroidota bacterium]|nr:phenylalanine--tRNA ligase subunit beta [Bacteroidota bacterium]
MKISYNWLQQYIDIDIPISKLSEMLTNIGLEVEGLEEYSPVKGGLEGFVIGEVKTCLKHRNATNLSLTTVDIGEREVLNIVCGAANVEAGQKVVVATVGTTVYSDESHFRIKKSKIRGEESHGMICAEDELGLGKGHDGIMVLDADAKPGLAAKDYFNIQKDYIFEIGLTPNRIDAASHFGVARDVAAYLLQDHKVNLQKPDVSKFKIDNKTRPVDVIVENNEACHRYSGITISNISVNESPEWLQTHLKAIGLKPINNVVDITNFVMHELGQPLHAFDLEKVKGDTIIVKTLADGTEFITLDEEKRKLSTQDLMICNKEKGMCIAGVFGGIDSGVTKSTKGIFLESAYFNPVSVRKTARRHVLNTDSSFRFERGTDPNITVYALKRAAMLITELTGGEISSDIVDLYPEPVKPFKVSLSFDNLDRLIGKHIEPDNVKQILKSLDIEITAEKDKVLKLLVPPYRVDVQREADVVEEILRIYGYNFIPVSKHVNSTITHYKKPDGHSLKNTISDMLSSIGFNEAMTNSLSKADYYNNLESFPASNLVHIFNPLSKDLNIMRQTLLFGGLETIAYNINRKNSSLKLYEFGNCYFKEDKQNHDPLHKYSQQQHIAIFISGNKFEQTWNQQEKESTFFEMKSYIHLILTRLGINEKSVQVEEFSNDIFNVGLRYLYNHKQIAEFGMVNSDRLKAFEIEQEVYYADINWDSMQKSLKANNINFSELPKYPKVRRDLAMIIDENIKFADISRIAYKTEKKLLRDVSIFDVYKGKNIPDGKKSYAVSFIIQDITKTLNEKYISKIMGKLASNLERELGAEIRK